MESAIDYLGGTPDAQSQRDCRRCVLQAFRAVTNARTWSYLTAHGRIHTAAPYMEGTVAFDLAGGAYPREVLLSGGTWPDWAGLGASLRIGDVTYDVLERRSDTSLTLSATLSPTADLAATSYILYRDVYVLPEDFVAADTAMFEANFGDMEFSDPTSWLGEQRFSASSGTPRCYTVTGHPLFPGRLVFRLSPYPDIARTVDFMYARRPRPLAIESHAAGTLSIVAGSPVATGDGTAWTAAMEGSILRLGTTRAAPTSWIGAAPPAFEARILEVVSATGLRLEAAPSAGHAEVRYVISDPADVERGAMENALLRGIEKFLHVARSIKEKPDAFAAYDMALREAQAADSRSYQGRSMGGASPRRVLKKDMPVDFG